LSPGGNAAIISLVTRERLAAFARRTIAYNRQPRKLALLPFSLAATVLAVYALVTGDPSITLMFVVLGLCLFVTVAEGAWWFAGFVREGYRAGAPKPK
jgi:hypothetical protein